MKLNQGVKMKCGHCKREGSEITVSHVRACSSVSPVGRGLPVSRTWQENKAVAVAKVLGSSDALTRAKNDAASVTAIVASVFGEVTPVQDARPAIVKAASVPAGRYALDNGNGSVRFFKVDCPTEGRWAGYTFVKWQAGTDEFPVRNRADRDAILARIAVNPEAASRLYGTELGMCGVCGRTLTNDESRAAGIGPVCAAKF
jgi:hypothetical protein